MKNILPDIELKDSPKDTISSLKFSKENLLLCTSWDCNLYLYSINNITSTAPSCLITQQIFNLPQLYCCFEGNNSSFIYSVGLDNDLKRIDLELLSNSIIGSHSNAINKVIYDENNLNCAITSSWDSTIKIFDIRINSKENFNQYSINMKPSEMILSGRNLCLAGIDKNNASLLKFYDIRNLNECVKSNESPLKYQTNAMSMLNNGEGVIIGSIEGKIGVEYLEEVGKKNYAFKCHREETEEKTIVYAVNSIVTHPK
jgi:WD40 repeat protein